MAAMPDIRQAVPGEIAHHALLFPIGTALNHPAVIENINLFHQAPAPGKCLQLLGADGGLADVLLIGTIFHWFDVEFNLAILPVLPAAGNLIVGLGRVDHNDFKFRTFVTALFFKLQKPIDIFQRLFKGQAHDPEIGVGLKALNGYFQFMKAGVEQTPGHFLGEKAAMAGDLDIPGFLNPGGDVGHPLGQFTIQHGFVH